MEKVTIPKNADCFAQNSGRMTYHVSIKNDFEFESFCIKNNIGYHDGARKDITMSINHVFSEDKNVFENFPENVDVVQF